MAIELNDNTRVNAPKPSDAWQGPYASVAAAVAAIPSAFIYPGRTVLVTVNGQAVEYWFKDGTNLIEKTVASNGGDTGTDRNVTASVSQGTIKPGDVVTVGKNSTNADLLEKLITAPAAPAFTLTTIYATTTDINTLTAISLKVFATGWDIVIAFAAESDGKKQSFWLPDSLTPGTLQVSRWDDTNRLSEFPVTGSGAQNGVSGKYYTYNGTDRGAIKIYLASSDAPAPADVWDDAAIWDDNKTWND